MKSIYKLLLAASTDFYAEFLILSIEKKMKKIAATGKAKRQMKRSTHDQLQAVLQ